MNQKKKKYYIDKVLNAAQNYSKCENLHHKKAHQHEAEYMCPAEYELDKAIHEVRKMLNELI